MLLLRAAADGAPRLGARGSDRERLHAPGVARPRPRAGARAGRRLIRPRRGCPSPAPGRHGRRAWHLRAAGLRRRAERDGAPPHPPRFARALLLTALVMD